MQRDTRQRKAIRKALVEAGHPLSPQELHEAAQEYVAGLGIATVYRNIRALGENGFLESVELPGEPPRYEVAGKGHHHHFHCRSCDRVFEVDGCPGNLDRITPSGFQLEDHEFVLYGQCVECVA